MHSTYLPGCFQLDKQLELTTHQSRSISGVPRRRRQQAKSSLTVVVVEVAGCLGKAVRITGQHANTNRPLRAAPVASWRLSMLPSRQTGPSGPNDRTSRKTWRNSCKRSSQPDHPSSKTQVAAQLHLEQIKSIKPLLHGTKSASNHSIFSICRPHT